MDEGLIRPINLITKLSLLGGHNVKDVFVLNYGKLKEFRENVVNVIFITRPFLAQMDMISENICRYKYIVNIQ